MDDEFSRPPEPLDIYQPGGISEITARIASGLPLGPPGPLAPRVDSVGSGVGPVPGGLLQPSTPHSPANPIQGVADDLAGGDGVQVDGDGIGGVFGDWIMRFMPYVPFLNEP
jgi:hypothetical protein